MTDQISKSNGPTDESSGQLTAFTRRRFLQSAAAGLATVGAASGGAGAIHTVAEVQQLSIDEDWHTENYDNSYSNPVVLANPLSYDGPDPCHARLNEDGTSGGFDVFAEEWEYLNGSHTYEDVGSLVIEAGTRETGSGSKIEAGTLQLEDANIKTVSFSQSFDRPPVVLSDVQTYNGSDPVVTRNDNVSSSSFDVGMQEESSNMDDPTTMYHVQERVGYVAVEEGSGIFAGREFEAGTISQVTDEWSRISFLRNYKDPIVLAGQQTRNNGDPNALRYRNLTSTGVEIFIEEETSEDSETEAVEEVLGYLVFEGDPASVTALTSQFDFDENWKQRSYETALSTPVVFAKPISYNGTDPSHTRLRNATSANGVTEFEAQVEEWEYLNGSHYDETVSSIALEAGTHTTASGAKLEVGTEVVSVEYNWNDVTFSQNFDNTPVVFTQIQTNNDGTAVVTRNFDVSTSDFSTMMQAEEAIDSHGEETIGYLAVSRGTGTIEGKPFEAGVETNVDHTWKTITFSQTYNDPLFVADMQTALHRDTCALRYRNLTSDSVEVFVEEEQSSDSETSHDKAEDVGYLVVEGNPCNLGGGVNYPYTVPSSQADYTVDTDDWSTLKNHLEDASYGETVYVTTDVTVDPDNTPATMNDGVILASDRGINGAAGSTIELDQEEDSNGEGIHVIHTGADNRITGLDFSGPVHDWEKYDDNLTAAIQVRQPAVEVDNCDMHGWDGMCVWVEGPGLDSSLNGDAYVHHCDMHDNPADGYGYGVVVYRGAMAWVNSCTFNYNRHSIAAGEADESNWINSYTVENCWFGPDAPSEGHVIDHHGPHSESELTVRNCTIEHYGHQGIRLRTQGDYSNGIPKYLDIENVWFYHKDDDAPGEETKDDDPPSDGEYAVRSDYGANNSDWSTWEDLGVYFENHDIKPLPEPDDSIGHAR